MRKSANYEDTSISRTVEGLFNNEVAVQSSCPKFAYSNLMLTNISSLLVATIIGVEALAVSVSILGGRLIWIPFYSILLALRFPVAKTMLSSRFCSSTYAMI